MVYASKAGHATTNPDNPSAFGVCDRCGQTWNLQELPWQFDWRGNRLMNLKLRICPPCQDKPFNFNRPIVVPPDPVPVFNPRPQQTDTGEVGWSMGGWSTGGWSVGQSPINPAPVIDPAPPVTNLTIDDD